MMRVLVTGGAGYIGSVAVERLRAAGHEVAVLDSLWRGHRQAVPADVPVHECDLLDAARVVEVIAQARPEAVMHFAAAAIVPESVEDPARYFAVNVVGSHNLLAAMRRGGVSLVVYSSTAAVYGVPASLPIDEETPTEPINPYGRSKLMVEHMLPWYDRAYGLRYAAFRYFNVAGATEQCGEDHRPETHVIPVALHVLLGKREQFQVFGTDYPTPDGTAIRDYVHVVDLVDAHLLALELLRADDRSLGAMNLGTTDGFSVKQIVAAVERVTGRPLPVVYAERRPGDPPALVADGAKARDLLGWRPNRSTLDQMVESAWAWYQRHPEGYGGDGRG
jgi:UDP-glucose 4-epimerase